MEQLNLFRAVSEMTYHRRAILGVCLSVLLFAACRSLPLASEAENARVTLAAGATAMANEEIAQLQETPSPEDAASTTPENLPVETPTVEPTVTPQPELPAPAVSPILIVKGGF